MELWTEDMVEEINLGDKKNFTKQNKDKSTETTPIKRLAWFLTPIKLFFFSQEEFFWKTKSNGIT